AEQEGLEEAGLSERVIIIDAELVGELLRIEGPALGISREEAELAQRRNVLRLLGDADLQVMARNALVVAERRQRVFRPVADILEVDEVDRRARAIEGRAAII